MSSFSWKKRLIFIAVILHFLVGIMAAFPPNYYISQYLTYTPFYPFIKLYSFLDILQHWTMFCPPPREAVHVKYSAHTAAGWSPFIEPFVELGEKFEKSFLVVPQGLTRILVFLRSTDLDLNLEKVRLRKFYFYQMSNYYCFGDGKIPGLLGIRFFLDIKPVPYFYPNDEYGNPLPLASTKDNQVWIYERDCSNK